MTKDIQHDKERQVTRITATVCSTIKTTTPINMFPAAPALIQPESLLAHIQPPGPPP